MARIVHLLGLDSLKKAARRIASVYFDAESGYMNIMTRLGIGSSVSPSAVIETRNEENIYDIELNKRLTGVPVRENRFKTGDLGAPDASAGDVALYRGNYGGYVGTPGNIRTNGTVFVHSGVFSQSLQTGSYWRIEVGGRRFQFNQTGSFVYFDNTGNKYTGFRAPAALSDNIVYALPAVQQPGTLHNDGSGNLSWATGAMYLGVYDFDVGPGGQQEFTVGASLNGAAFTVEVNGIVQRLGAIYSYTFSGSTVTFNAPVPENAWVRVTIYPSSMANYEFDVTNPLGQTTFQTSESTLSDKTVLVSIGGMKLREGVDYTFSGGDVVFAYTIPENAWVSVMVLY